MTEANIGSSVSTIDLKNNLDQDSNDNKKLNRGTYRSWKNDQNEEGKTSLDTIVDWLAEGENYSKYKGSLKTPGESNKKTAYCKTIAEILVETGHQYRDFKGIMSQITELETKFKAAVKELRKCASANNLTDIDLGGDHNEAVIDEKGNRKLLKDVVKKKFKYFYVLRSMFVKWEENLDIGSSEITDPEISTSPPSNKRQREHEEQYFDAPDTETRDDIHAHINSVSPSSAVVDFEHGNNHAHTNHHENPAMVHNHNNSSSNSNHNNKHNNNIVSNIHHTPIFPNYRMPIQYPPQQYNLTPSNDSEQARKKQKKLQKQQSEERFSQSLSTLLEEQKETVVNTRKTGDKHYLLEEERLLLEKKKLALEERRITLEEKKEERLAFFATLDKLGPADPNYSELLTFYMKKQLAYENDKE